MGVTFEYVFTETGEAGNLVATETFEDVEYSTLTEMELNTANAKDFTEHIWGHDTFETPELGLCAPANVVEGAAEELQPQEAASSSLCLSNDPLELENLDLLQWIVNDQDINIEIEEPKQEAEVPNHQEVERVSVIVPVVSQQFRIEPLEVK